MSIAAIAKIIVLAVGGLTVLNYVPGVNILDSEKSDYKALVRCSAKLESLERKYEATRDELKDERRNSRDLGKKLKNEQKAKKKVEKRLRAYIADSVPSSRDRVRGDKENRSPQRSLLPWRR